MLINLSNHPSDRWDESQKKAAKDFGEIIDIPFPEVSPLYDENDILNLANEYVSMIKQIATLGDSVMVQGEFSLTYSLINELKKAGYRTISACSERKSRDYKGADGQTVRESVFTFVRFREYI